MRKLTIAAIVVVLIAGSWLLVAGVRAAWQEPSGAKPPMGNILSPLLLGPAPQARLGNLCLGAGCTTTIPETLQVKGNASFRDVTVGKNLTVDSDTLFVDSNAHKVAIGTVDPAQMTAKLSVVAGALDGVFSSSNPATAVLYGHSTAGVGIKADHTVGGTTRGIESTGNSAAGGVGVYGTALTGSGVYGTSSAGTAVYGSAASGGFGVYGESLNAAGGTGVEGEGQTLGVYAHAAGCSGTCSAYSALVQAPTAASGNLITSVYAEQPAVDPGFLLRYAAYFAGPVRLGPLPGALAGYGSDNAIPELIGQRFLPLRPRPSIIPFTSGQVLNWSANTGTTNHQVAFDGTDVWVTNDTQTVTKVRSSDGAVLGQYVVADPGEKTEGIVFDGQNLWTANTYADSSPASLSYFSPADPTPTGVQIARGITGAPRYLTFDGTSVWISHELASGSLTKVDVTTKVITSNAVTNLNNPRGVAFDGSNLWVANSGTNELLSYPTNCPLNVPVSCASLATIPLGGAPQFVTYDGRYLWVTVSTGASVGVKRIDPKTNVVDFTVSLANPREVVVDGTYVWVTQDGVPGQLTQILAADVSVVRTITINAASASMGAAFDGTYVYVAQAADGVSKVFSGTGYGSFDTSSLVRLQLGTVSAQTGNFNTSGSGTFGGNVTVGTPQPSWENTGQLSSVVQAHALMQANVGCSGWLYAATEAISGIFRSQDGGNSWTLIGPSNTREFVDIIQASDGTIYAGGQGPGAKPAVYKSSDCGNSWSTTGTFSGATTVQALVQATSGSIYAGTDANGDVFKLESDGVTWTNQGDLTGAVVVNSLLADGGALYAGTSNPGGVYKSTNGGASWQQYGPSAEVYELYRASDGTIYAGTGSSVAVVYKSTDGGVTWTSTGGILAGASIVDALVQATDGSLYAGTGYNGDVFRSTNGGTTWMNTGDLAGATYVSDFLRASDGTIYVATVPNGDVFKLATGTVYVGDLTADSNVWGGSSDSVVTTIPAPATATCPGGFFVKGVTRNVGGDITEIRCRPL